MTAARALHVTPHITRNDNGRRSNVDGRTTRHPGYSISLSCRWLVEKTFGWLKGTGPLRQVKVRGLAKVDWIFVFSCAAHNLLRLPRLIAQETTQELVMVMQRVPKVLFCDNGSEFTSQAMDLWAYRNGVMIDFSRPGKPTDNAFVESFNGTFRAECLDTHWFVDLKEARQLIEASRQEYNESRPHASLKDRTPSEFAHEIAASRDLMAT